MKGDYGTIHIELPAEMPAGDAEILFDQIARLVHGEAMYEKYDLMASMHTDGPCEDSPHCWGANERRLRERLAAEIEAERTKCIHRKCVRCSILADAASIVRGATADTDPAGDNTTERT